MIRWFKEYLLKIYKVFFSILAFVLPKKDKLIVFESFLGKQYSDNPRAIYEYMIEHYPDHKMYWSVDRNYLANFQDKEVLVIRRFSLKWTFLMARAKYWVTNSRLPLWIPKPKNTIYLQTWHGTPLKKLGIDIKEVHMPGTSTEEYKKNFTKEASKWNYLVSPNAYSTEIFKRAFQFNGTVIESGYPRNDFLINNNKSSTINKIKAALNLPVDKKIILYAPTWRDNQFFGVGKYKLDLKIDLKKIHQELGDEYIVLLRAHYLVSQSIELEQYEGFVYDCSNHSDIRDLYLISDVLITDYSSVFFDYAVLHRPIIFFVYDIDEYRDSLRGFYFDLQSEAPGPLVRTTEEIIDEVKKVREEGFNFTGKHDAFYQKYCYLEDGRASERIVKSVFK